MKYRVERVFEKDLDQALDAINEAGSELLRIFDLPKGPLRADDCKDCKKGEKYTTLCADHAGERSRIDALNLHRTVDLTFTQMGNLTVYLNRYALVYKTR